LIKKELSAGVIVFRWNGKRIEFLLLKHGKGHWAFPKGHLENAETKLEAALRELYEETGIKDVELLSNEIYITDSYTYSQNGITIEKSVEYFIGELKGDRIKIDGNEIDDYKWSPLDEALNIISFEQSKQILIKANNILQSKKLNYEKH
jgi:bis(5'-nucleosidyl)-tetraphosphatase